MKKNVHLYYRGLNIYPSTEDEECWKFCEGLEASGFYSNTALKWLNISLGDPSFFQIATNPDSLGIIFLSTCGEMNPETVLRINRPTVFTDFSLSFSEKVIASYPESYLLVKNEEAAVNILARHLIAKGHKRIFFLKSIEDNIWENIRLNRFVKAINELSSNTEVIQMQHDPIAAKSYRLKMGILSKKMDKIDVKNIAHKLGTEVSELVSITQFATIIQKAHSQQMKIAETYLHKEILKSGCSAVVGSNDKTAIRYLKFCEQEGINIPDSMSVAGFDNSTMGDHRLTSVDFGYRTGGTIAANLITQPDIRLHQKTSIIELPCRLIDRNTVKDNENA